MRRASSTLRLVAALLLGCLTPGVGEAVENLGHLLASGHLAHAEEAEHHHEEPGDEHGCNGVFHLCSCHSTLRFLQPSTTLPLFTTAAVARPAVAPESRLLSGFHRIPDKPPRRI
jgi:hypothetical protein